MLKFDDIVIGSGLAGLYAAYKASMRGSVAVITKSFVRESNSFNAPGGIAAVTSEDDSLEIHKSDMLIAANRYWWRTLLHKVLFGKFCKSYTYGCLCPLECFKEGRYQPYCSKPSQPTRVPIRKLRTT